jgi:hypothetical protein
MCALEVFLLTSNKHALATCRQDLATQLEFQARLTRGEARRLGTLRTVSSALHLIRLRAHTRIHSPVSTYEHRLQTRYRAQEHTPLQSPVRTPKSGIQEDEAGRFHKQP